MNINKIINEQINSLILEKIRNLTNKQKSAINKETDDLAREVYGDEYGEPDEDVANKYKLDGYRKDVDIKGGPFSVGNQKLSPDTLIINFTKKSPRKPTAFRRGMNWENYYFLIIFQFIAIFIVIHNNKY